MILLSNDQTSELCGKLNPFSFEVCVIDLNIKHRKAFSVMHRYQETNGSRAHDLIQVQRRKMFVSFYQRR